MSGWRPEASLANLRARAHIVDAVRLFFKTRGYLEVETPIMGKYGVTDVYLSNIQASFRNATYFLQTSPEYHMKRLLAAGSGPIFQLSKVFRDDELGRWHNPEFTLLEWYALDVDHHAMVDQVDVLLQHIMQSNPLIKKTYQQVFLEILDVDPLTAPITALQQCLVQHGLDNVLNGNESDKDQYLFLLMSHVIEPALAATQAPVAVTHFPPSQAALAKIQDGVAQRFEVYYQGVELANGFHELTDKTQQALRFHQDNHHRQQKGFPPSPLDPNFLQALENGLPPCSGVAIGLDRVIALALKQKQIADVMAFPFDRA